jgi:signal transduction histidine kinase
MARDSDSFPGKTRMHAGMRVFDWDTSPFGPPDAWPKSLRSIVRLMLDSAFPMCLAWGPELRLLYNDAYLPIIGTRHPAALGARMQDVWAPIWPTMEPVARRALAGEPGFLENFPVDAIRLGRPSRRWFTLAYSRVHDDEARVAGLLCAGSETTEQVLMERDHAFQLRLSEHLRGFSNADEITAHATRLLGQHLGVARAVYLEIDEDRASLVARPDWTGGELPSLASRAFPLQDCGVAALAQLKAGRALRVNDVASAEEAVLPLCADWMGARSVLAVPLFRGGRLCAILQVHDTHAHPWSEDEVALAQETAERAWAALERTSAHERRRMAEEKLKEAGRRKDEFVVTLAHELRNPIAPIAAAAELLSLPGIGPADVGHAGEVISRQVGHMTDLVNDLLDISRIASGLVELHQRLLDVNEIVIEAIEQVEPLLKSRAHHLAMNLACEPARVWGDHLRLVQVVANLLSNAAKYTPRGGEILVTVELDEEDVSISVRDNGIGMPAELVDSVFELFAQVKRTSDRRDGGLGIGLALVKGLVERHGGRVSAHSAGMGLGSVFQVVLPRLLPPETPVA